MFTNTCDTQKLLMFHLLLTKMTYNNTFYTHTKKDLVVLFSKLYLYIE